MLHKRPTHFPVGFLLVRPHVDQVHDAEAGNGLGAEERKVYQGTKASSVRVQKPYKEIDKSSKASTASGLGLRRWNWRAFVITRPVVSTCEGLKLHSGREEFPCGPAFESFLKQEKREETLKKIHELLNQTTIGKEVSKYLLE